MDEHKYRDEADIVAELLSMPPLDESQSDSTFRDACEIVRRARSKSRPVGVLESFLEEFGLTTPEGLALMCLAEGLLRVKDQETADKLIAEKITSGDWGQKLGTSESLLINASIFGLMLTGKVVDIEGEARNNFGAFVHKLTRKAGEPVIRAAVYQAMRIMGEQFVLGRNIKSAIKRGASMAKKSSASNFSFDMLGEGARTDQDAKRYFTSYANAIEALGAEDNIGICPKTKSGISVKLSALHARYDARQLEKVQKELYPRVLELAAMAAKYNIGFCIDAEEADRLGISLDILENLAKEPKLMNWDGLGLAVQAYQKRVRHVIKRIGDIARQNNRIIMVRLVKGAYWDAEIKRAQNAGRPDFPVFTTKTATDVSYLAAAKDLFENKAHIYPQFATHNAHSLAAVINLAKSANATDYEFQRLHGMGETLYEVAREIYPDLRVRVYAPVGAHEDLLPYLVRRLLENGANTSFVHAFLDPDVPIEKIVADPIKTLKSGPVRHTKVPVPKDLYSDGRINSKGYDLTILQTQKDFEIALADFKKARFNAHSIIDGKEVFGHNSFKITSPSDVNADFGISSYCPMEQISAASKIANRFQKQWDILGANARSQILENMANGLEDNFQSLIATLVFEAGKTFEDAIAEVREAIDFCRYYAIEARKHFNGFERLNGPFGEINEFTLMGRGTFVCISPWNFPLAIFTGQIAAALAAGNCVLAKPAEQTPLIAYQAIKIFQNAGLPKEALQLILGDGEIGAAMVGLDDIEGVAFTGSTSVAQKINQTLAAKPGPIATLIAETGGLNAMFTDTTALKEQIVDDVIISAFGSAGQRCSALRLLFVPKDNAEDIIECLKGALDELNISSPDRISTDIGPVIDKEALGILKVHKEKMKEKIIYEAKLGENTDNGHFFAPLIIEIDNLDELEKEVFGPILHILRYDPEEIDTIGAQLAAKKYGLTLGCHSRLDSFVEKVRHTVPAGNYYVNRSMTGAVVGVQPFGGLGLSGTGPKAGGPHYLPRFATEQVKSENIAAKGGDPLLFNL